MTHDVAVVDGNRCASSSEVNQSNAVFLFNVRQDSLCSGFGCEVFLLRGYAALYKQVVGILEILLLSDEYLEMSFEHIACHSDDVVLYDLEILSV